MLICEPESKRALNSPERPLFAVILMIAVPSRTLPPRAFAEATVEGFLEGVSVDSDDPLSAYEIWLLSDFEWF